MRKSVLSVAITFVLAAPCTAFAGDKGKQQNIEVQDYGFGVSMPVTSSRSDGGGSTVGRKQGNTATPRLTVRKAGGRQQVEYLNSPSSSPPAKLGRVQHGDIKIIKHLDKSSPILLQSSSPAGGGSAGPPKPTLPTTSGQHR
jgi:type VI protein secretion system component Hcp